MLVWECGEKWKDDTHDDDDDDYLLWTVWTVRRA